MLWVNKGLLDIVDNDIQPSVNEIDIGRLGMKMYLLKYAIFKFYIHIIIKVKC